MKKAHPEIAAVWAADRSNGARAITARSASERSYAFSAERGHSCPQPGASGEHCGESAPRRRPPAAADRNVRAPFLLGLALFAALVPSVLGQPALFWENTAAIISPPDVPPQIDAINFVNDRTAILSITFGVGDSLPFFETSDTLNYTNRGLMQVDTGWKFDTEPATIGYPHWAANFDNSGEIDTAVTSGNISSNIFTFLSLSGGPRTFVSATNIVNSGLIHSAFEGLVSLKGGNVDLRRGTIT